LQRTVSPFPQLAIVAGVRLSPAGQAAGAQQIFMQRDASRMGMFLSMAGTPVPEIPARSALERIRQLNRFGDFDFWCEESPKHRTLVVFSDETEHVDEICQALSIELKLPVFYFHVHDGELWLFHLYHDGKLVDRFTQLPDFFGDLDKASRESWRGNAKLIAELWPDVRHQDIAKYLVFQHDASSERKAYRDDEFDPWECWQVCDFMAKLGLEYPDIEELFEGEEDADDDDDDLDDDDDDGEFEFDDGDDDRGDDDDDDDDRR